VLVQRAAPPDSRRRSFGIRRLTVNKVSATALARRRRTTTKIPDIAKREPLAVEAGVAGLIWAGIWLWRYRGPEESSQINAAEIQHIQSGGGLAGLTANPASAAAKRNQWADLVLVLSRRKLWGIYIGQFAVNSTLWFFLTWFPTYLVKYRHMDFIKAGFYASLPFLAAFFGVLVSGLLSDFLVRRGWSATRLATHGRRPAASARSTRLTSASPRPRRQKWPGGIILTTA
jgi:Major Facilitator Superfamily